MENQQISSEEDTKGVNYIEVEIPYHIYQSLNSGQCNLEALCRICLNTNSNSMFRLFNGKDKSILAEIFTVTTCVQLLPDDGLPSSICESCHTQLLQSHEFKIKSEKSNCLLKSIVKGEFILKEEPNITHMNQTEVKDVKNELINGNKIDNQAELVEDIHLEESCENNSNDAMHIIQNTRERKKKKPKRNITGKSDAKRLPKDVVLDSNTQKKGEAKYTCVICGKKFTKLNKFRAHTKESHTTTTGFPCAQCKKSFNSEHDLTVHSSLHAKACKGNWKCNTCGKLFKEKAMLRRHIQRHMESKPHSCDVCAKAFTELYALRRHSRVHTGEFVEKKHACHLCDKRYTEAGLLAAHVARHEGRRPCECGACGKRFPSPRLLASHRRVHSDRKPHACDLCDKRFRHESTRNTHRRTHTGERPYVCSACGKAFIQNSNLTLHMRSHTGERPYSCSKCDKKFSSSSSLKSHMRIHTGERPYGCNICGKKFARLSMRAHMAAHAGARPFACGACPKTFLKAARLREHTRVHTGEKPFECTTCPAKFATKNHLIKHVKMHERKKRPEKHEAMIVQVNNVQAADIEIVCKDKDKLAKNNIEAEETPSNDLTLETVHEVPLEVTGELVVGGVVVFYDNVQSEHIS